MTARTRTSSCVSAVQLDLLDGADVAVLEGRAFEHLTAGDEMTTVVVAGQQQQHCHHVTHFAHATLANRLFQYFFVPVNEDQTTYWHQHQLWL